VCSLYYGYRYVPHKWSEIVSGSIYDQLPKVKSWCDACVDLSFYKLACDLFPELKGHFEENHIQSATLRLEPETVSETVCEDGGGDDRRSVSDWM